MSETSEPAWAPMLRHKAEFYAARFGVETGEMKMALHDIFSMLSLHNVGPYAEPTAQDDGERQ